MDEQISVDPRPQKNPFDYQKPTEKSVAEIATIRQVCKNLAGLIEDVVPFSRERSVAMTKLEEVSMWVNKAICFSQVMSPEEVTVADTEAK